MSQTLTAASAPSAYALRMWLFFAGYLLLGGVSVPFFPVWLAARGLSETEIASCIAIPIAVRVFLTPLAGAFADRAPSRRFAVRVFTVVGFVLFLFAWNARSYWPILLTTGTATVIWSMAGPVADAMALTGVRRFGLAYGRMRFGGSAAFLLSNLASGALVGIIAADSIFYLLAVVLCVGALASFVLPARPAAVRALDEAERPAPQPARLVLSNPSFLALVLVGGLIQASHAVLYSFGSIRWQGLGLGGAEIGALWAIGVTCEILLFMGSRRMHRTFGTAGLLFLGGFAAILRWVLLSFDLGFVGFAASQTLHGLTFGAVYLGNQHAIARAVPDELTASAQGLFGMIQGILLALSTALAGPLYQTFGAEAFLFMILPAAAGLLILVAHQRFIVGRPAA